MEQRRMVGVSTTGSSGERRHHQRLRLVCFFWLLPLLLTLPSAVQAQFTCTANNGTITITGYTGAGGTVVIPDTINSLPVTGIGEYAFFQIASLTNVTIPDSVTNIGDYAFAHCTSLTAISVDPLNSFYSSVDGVLFNKSGTMLVVYPVGKAGSFTIPNSVTNIGESAFEYCISLTNVTIPNSVISIGGAAFYHCTNLTSVTIPNSVCQYRG